MKYTRKYRKATFISVYLKFLIINDFGVSDAILLGGANSGQSSIKCCDLACDVEPLLLNNYIRICP